MKLFLFNTLSRKIEEFHTKVPNVVKLYTCGPTVYHYAHIGNLRTYIFEDLLRRILQIFGYKVIHVMNITDVGHLESDEDFGDDKITASAIKEKKTPTDIARYYEEIFLQDCASLNLIKPTLLCRASEHIEEIQNMINQLLEKKCAYIADGNVYFDVSCFDDYAKLSRSDLINSLNINRVDFDFRKKNQKDFVLWFSNSKFQNQIMRWNSPWGIGFPGWHIECSAMSAKYLGEYIDIHCGGVDHIPVHHTNEIAQLDCCFGHQCVNFWMHGEFLTIDKNKMSKSKNNSLTLATIKEHGFESIHYRYLCLGTHYRSQLFFSYESLQMAKNALESLRNRVADWESKLKNENIDNFNKNSNKKEFYSNKFKTALFYDLNVPIALSVLWEVAKDTNLSIHEKFNLISEFDIVLGLGLIECKKPKLSEHLMDLIKKREELRKQKNWSCADEIRKEIEKNGVFLKDTENGTDWYLRQ